MVTVVENPQLLSRSIPPTTDSGSEEVIKPGKKGTTRSMPSFVENDAKLNTRYCIHSAPGTDRKKRLEEIESTENTLGQWKEVQRKRLTSNELPGLEGSWTARNWKCISMLC